MRFTFRWAFLAVLCGASLVWSQVGTSTISGRITDTTGAVVPNVNVMVTNVGTNFQFPTRTNQEGLFRVPSLQPGAYRVTIEAPGFKRFVRDNLTLRTGDIMAVDAALEVGALTESVEVKTEMPLLETETSATGQVVTGEKLYNIAINQRFVYFALNLVPGVTTVGNAYSGSLGMFNVSGQRSGTVGFFEDGMLGNDQNTGTGTIRPILNSIAEVKVLTTALPAEYGHSAGGVLNVVRRNGTNELHGMASWWGRSRRMQHRKFFDKYRTSQPQPGAPNGLPTWSAQPDANVGGPVVIPKVYDGHNKTFFFFSYQKFIEKKSNTTFGVTPTQDMKNGDFTFGGAGAPIYDPTTTRQLANGGWTRDPFPGNLIPHNRFDAVARKVLEIDPWHLPNSPGGFNSGGPIGNFTFEERSRTFFEDYGSRLDHQFSDNFKIFGSYTYNHQSGRGRPAHIRVQDFDASRGNLTPFTQQNYSTGATWVFSPSFINDVRFGYYRRRSDRFVPSYLKNYGQILGIPNISGDLLPAFGSGGEFTPDSTYGLTVSGPSRTIGETLSLRDDVTKITGTHAFKMGYEILRFRMNAWSVPNPSGTFLFNQMTAGLQANSNPIPNTGNSFAGFLLGWVRQAQFGQNLASWLPRSSIHSFYFQDDWKFSPTLTFNLGVRYTNESPFNTKYSQMSNFDPGAADPVTGRTGAIVHPTSGLNRRDSNNFQPRVGLAWHPREKLVFRGGFAVNTVDVKFPTSMGQFEEYSTQVNLQQAPGDPRALFKISNGPPAFAYDIRPNGTSGYLGTNYSARGAQWWDPGLRNPYVLNWNMSVQYQLTTSYLLELMYQGSSGVGLVENWQANTFPVDYGASDPALRAAAFAASQNYRPYTHFGDVLFRSNYGHSNYHAGTVKVEKRYSSGLSFLSFYTFGKAINSQDTDNSGSGVAPIQNRGLEKGRASYDRKHQFASTVTYELPVGKGRTFLNRGGFWNVLLGGYEVNYYQSILSGNPVTFTFAGSPYNYFPTYAGARRPNLVRQPTLINYPELGPDRFNQAGLYPVFDINDFAYPAAFTPGNAGRGIVDGPRLIWSSAAIHKEFRLTERFTLKLRLDYDNPFKWYCFDSIQASALQVNFSQPNAFAKLHRDGGIGANGGQPLMDLKVELTW